MPTERTCTFRVSMSASGVRRAIAAFDGFVAELGLSSDATWPVRVALDEWLTNLAEHASAVRNTKAGVACRFACGELEIVVRDSGPEFDPLAVPPPDTTAPIVSRKPGGLGIYFIRQLMDRVAYRRDGHLNELTFAKVVAPTPGIPPVTLSDDGSPRSS